MWVPGAYSNCVIYWSLLTRHSLLNKAGLLSGGQMCTIINRYFTNQQSMFSIPLKNNSREIDIVVTRSLLALAGIAAFVYRAGNYVGVNLIVGSVLFASAFLVDYLFNTLKVKKMVLLALAALMLFISTHSVGFALVLVLVAITSSLLDKKPLIIVDASGVSIQRALGIKNYPWNQFNNIILKDNLLTLDFKNNQLLQLEPDSTATINEQAFNDFCKKYLLV